MNELKTLTCLATVALFSALVSCTSYNDIPEGSEVETITSLGAKETRPIIVHTDMIARIATIRNGEELGDGYLIVNNKEEMQSAVLKGLPQDLGHLKIADILEGAPKINNVVIKATAEQSESYEKIYPSLEPDKE